MAARGFGFACLLAALGLAVVGCGTNYGDLSADPASKESPKKPKPGGGSGGGGGAPSRPAEVDAGSGGDAGAPEDPKPTLGLAKGLRVTEVAVFQGVKITVSKDGARVSTRRAPVVAGREGLVRVYVTPSADWSPRAVTAELALTTGGATVVLKDTKTIAGPSTDEATKSTLNIFFPGENVAPDTTYAVSLKTEADAASADGTEGARYPATGEESLGARSSGESLKIALVPVRYDADGSARAPDTNAAQIERYRKRMYQLYPAKKVEITLHEPFSFGSTISRNGAGWGELLQEITSLRQDERAAKDVYYYGVFTPTSDFASFCRGGCVAGLSNLSRPGDSWSRASIGLGYTGDNAGDTMAHEVGHAHGRAHSPCGVSGGTDPSFPYANGALGTWGYDIVAKGLIAPTKAKDLMGYCHPTWVSDFTYNALFQRMASVNGAMSIFTPAEETSSSGLRYRIVDVGADGSLKWGRAITLFEPPLSEPHTIAYEGSDGRVIDSATGFFYAYSDLPGGYMLVPESATPYAALSISGLSADAQSRIHRDSK